MVNPFAAKMWSSDHLSSVGAVRNTEKKWKSRAMRRNGTQGLHLEVIA